MKGVNINTSDIIQASFNCLDQERGEFEKIIEDKNKLILDKEKTVSTIHSINEKYFSEIILANSLIYTADTKSQRTS